MSKQNTRNNSNNLWDYVSITSAAIFILFLILNIYNRLLIIDILSKKSLGSVGVDAPLQYPLIVGLATAAIAYVSSKHKPSKLWLVAVTILFVGLIIWVFGLKLALKNSFQI